MYSRRLEGRGKPRTIVDSLMQYNWVSPPCLALVYNVQQVAYLALVRWKSCCFTRQLRCLVGALSDGFGWDPGEAASVPVVQGCRQCSAALCWKQAAGVVVPYQPGVLGGLQNGFCFSWRLKSSWISTVFWFLLKDFEVETSLLLNMEWKSA